MCPLKVRRQCGLLMFQSFNWLSVDLWKKRTKQLGTQKQVTIKLDAVSKDPLKEAMVPTSSFRVFFFLQFFPKSYISRGFYCMALPTYVTSVLTHCISLISLVITFESYLRRDNFLCVDKFRVWHSFPVAFEDCDWFGGVTKVIIMNTMICERKVEIISGV